jgi:hypothetical protein
MQEEEWQGVSPRFAIRAENKINYDRPRVKRAHAG